MIVVIALFGLVAMQTHSMRSLNNSRESHLASVLAGNFMSQTEAMLESDYEGKYDRALAPVDDHPGYSAEVKVVPVGPELKKIRVEVKWSEGPSSAHRILETTVAKPY